MAIYNLKIELKPQQLQDVFMYMKILVLNKPMRSKMWHELPEEIIRAIKDQKLIDADTLRELEAIFEEQVKEASTPKRYLS